MSRKPYFIAIAGPSCSGKTTVARHVASALSATIFSLDSYYLDLSHLPPSERTRFNFDDPASLEDAKITEHLYQLAAGKPVVRPVYDFTTHTRGAMTETIQPNDFIIVEGLFTLYWESVRPLYSTKVFMEAAHEVCLPRRQARDVAERGRTVESVLRQYVETVQPMAEAHINPTRQFADLVLSGTQPIAQSAEAVLAHVRQVRGVKG